METKSALGKRINVHSNFWRDIEPPGFICQTYSIQICCILGIHGSYLGANIRFQASIADIVCRYTKHLVVVLYEQQFARVD